MAVISPLSSPEYVHDENPVPMSADRGTGRRLTHDLEEDVSLSPANNQLTLTSLSWSFLDQYSDVVGIDKEEMDFPFDENGDSLPLPLSLPQPIPLPLAIPLPPVSHNAETLTPSSQGSSVQSTHTLQDDVCTPIPGVKVHALLGETLELGNCTYEIDQNNLTMTPSKLNRTRSVPTDRSLVAQSPFACGVSSTPMRNGELKSISNLVTSHAASSVKSHLVFDNVMYKSPIRSPKSLRAKPIELAIKPADSTVDLEIGCDLDRTANYDEEPLKKTDPPPEAEPKTQSIPFRKAATKTTSKKPSHLPAPRRLSQRSVLPVVSGKLSKNRMGSRVLQGLRASSSTGSLAQVPTRGSLLPTCPKSRSHGRISTAAPSGRTLKELH